MVTGPHHQSCSDSDLSATRAPDVWRGVRAPRVLIAEDNSINAELLAMTARRLGVDVAHAADGEEAVAMTTHARMVEKPFLLLLMDVMMPVMGGLQATRTLRQSGFSPRHLPIIAITAAASSAEVQSYIAAGMQACLSKPVLRETLEATFVSWLPGTARTKGAGQELHKPSLQERYEQRKSETLEHIEAALAADELQPEIVAEIRNLLHKLAGTAGSFDEAPLSDAATYCEAALIEAPPDQWYATLADSRSRLLRAA